MESLYLPATIVLACLWLTSVFAIIATRPKLDGSSEFWHF